MPVSVGFTRNSRETPRVRPGALRVLGLNDGRPAASGLRSNACARGLQRRIGVGMTESATSLPSNGSVELPASGPGSVPFQDQLWTMQEVADYLRVPKRTVEKWREQRKGPLGRMVGRSLRFRVGDVQDWLSNRPLT